ncbi:guanine nucleotide-binding protein G(I)/G(S)/G(O) subunit gamma-13 [Sorex araneus]|uniref:guanine nucleotide-binding protein G(I)/G(S)/G(O) subunit gamma-13 n=1 Tax=Sorex araneus TaxID=42254 RepID=UPI0024338CF4|nr:guanine nucleotide-binding protein G(I)/G(S)/G(O) subunit gamma-13 [Sorex araneus]
MEDGPRVSRSPQARALGIPHPVEGAAAASRCVQGGWAELGPAAGGAGWGGVGRAGRLQGSARSLARQQPALHYTLGITWSLSPLCSPRLHPSPKLAAPEAADPTEEWDEARFQKEVESLKYQLAFKREMSSKSIPELLKWIEDGIPKDPFLNPDLMKNNPWVEKGKCSIL